MISVEQIFRRLRAVVEEQYPSISIKLIVDDERAWDPMRGFAYCAIDESGEITVGIPPRMFLQSRSRVEGVLMHEFGHAVLVHQGHDDHCETEADAVAEDIFGRQISYDDEDIQTTGTGVRPRPAYLTNGCS